MVLCSIGAVYYAQGKHDDALATWQDVLQVREQTLGLEHPLAADTLYNMALVHRTQGQHNLEAACFDKCALIRAKVYGDGHIKSDDARKQALCAHAAAVLN